STVLGGWSGATFTSTLLTIADFSPLSRGFDAPCAISDAEGRNPHPDRRSARRQPALSGPPWDTERKATGVQPSRLTTRRNCKSGARLEAGSAGRLFANLHLHVRAQGKTGEALPLARGPPLRGPAAGPPPDRHAAAD